MQIKCVVFPISAFVWPHRSPPLPIATHAR